MLKKKLVTVRNLFIYNWHALLAKQRTSPVPKNCSADFVVSIASYPKRDHLLPAVFEALSRQTVKPKGWILVLSEEDYLQGLPKHLGKLNNLGVEILWVRNNPYAVKKLVPVMEKYPDLSVITFDDELIYGKQVIEKLIHSSIKYSGAIIGHAGKELRQKDGESKMLCRSNRNADLKTPSDEVYFLGGSGTFYPPNSLDTRMFALKAIHEIVPGRGSDIWFWAAAIAKGTLQRCLGSKHDRSLYFAIPEDANTKPLDQPGGEVMEKRFQMAIDYFGIREKLLTELPEQPQR